MKNREEYIMDTVTMLKSIQTLNDLKKSNKKILDMVLSLFKMAIDSLDYFMENMFSMSPEEREAESNKFQDETYFFPPEIGLEMDRIENIPGAAKYFESLKSKLEPQIGIYAEEFTSKMSRMLDSFMEGLMGGFSELTDSQAYEPEEEELVFDSDNPDTPMVLYDLYKARTCNDIEAIKESLIEGLQGQLQYDLDFLPLVTESRILDDEIYDRDQVRITEIRQRLDRLMPEIDKEFKRIMSKSDTPETALNIKNELLTRVGPLITETYDCLKKVQYKP